MMHVFGSAARLPLAPLAKSKPPIARALPNPTVPTSAFRCFMVSRIAIVGTICPPSLLMYRYIGLFRSALSRNNIVATSWFPSSSSIVCPIQMIRSRYKQFQISTHCHRLRARRRRGAARGDGGREHALVARRPSARARRRDRRRGVPTPRARSRGFPRVRVLFIRD